LALFLLACHDHDAAPGRLPLAAGTGLLDYDHYLALLRQAGYDGPLILHSLRGIG
jgi:sugar phosphate isomerase/epimerase